MFLFVCAYLKYGITSYLIMLTEIILNFLQHDGCMINCAEKRDRYASCL